MICVGHLPSCPTTRPIFPVTVHVESVTADISTGGAGAHWKDLSAAPSAGAASKTSGRCVDGLRGFESVPERVAECVRLFKPFEKCLCVGRTT